MTSPITLPAKQLHELHQQQQQQLFADDPRALQLALELTKATLNDYNTGVQANSSAASTATSTPTHLQYVCNFTTNRQQYTLQQQLLLQQQQHLQQQLQQIQQQQPHANRELMQSPTIINNINVIPNNDLERMINAFEMSLIAPPILTPRGCNLSNFKNKLTFSQFKKHHDDIDLTSLKPPLSDERSKKSQNMTECVPVPSSEHVAEIVGRQGCKIKALRAKTNTYIKTPVRGDEPVFIITGRKEDVAKAQREILSAADHFSLIRATRRPSYDSNGIGLMGIENNSGPNCDADSVSSVTGDASGGNGFSGSNVDEGIGGGAAFNAINSKGGVPLKTGQITIQVRVPYRVVGLVVGTKGATIKHIQQETQTYIVTPSREKEPIFEVTGLPDNVQVARKKIEAHIALRTGNTPTSNGSNNIAPAPAAAPSAAFDYVLTAGARNADFNHVGSCAGVDACGGSGTGIIGDDGHDDGISGGSGSGSGCDTASGGSAGTAGAADDGADGGGRRLTSVHSINSLSQLLNQTINLNMFSSVYKDNAIPAYMEGVDDCSNDLYSANTSGNIGNNDHLVLQNMLSPEPSSATFHNEDMRMGTVGSVDVVETPFHLGSSMGQNRLNLMDTNVRYNEQRDGPLLPQEQQQHYHNPKQFSKEGPFALKTIDACLNDINELTNSNETSLLKNQYNGAESTPTLIATPITTAASAVMPSPLPTVIATTQALAGKPLYRSEVVNRIMVASGFTRSSSSASSTSSNNGGGGSGGNYGFGSVGDNCYSLSGGSSRPELMNIWRSVSDAFEVDEGLGESPHLWNLQTNQTPTLTAATFTDSHSSPVTSISPTDSLLNEFNSSGSISYDITHHKKPMKITTTASSSAATKLSLSEQQQQQKLPPRICMLCEEKEASPTAIVPCGHNAFCTDCSKRIYQRCDSSEIEFACPICNLQNYHSMQVAA